MDYISILIGLVLGGMMLNKEIQAMLRNMLNMGKSNFGTLDIKRSGGGIVTRVVDFNKKELKTPEGTFLKNYERVYRKMGVAHAVANAESTNLIENGELENLEKNLENEELNVKCGECGAELKVTIKRPVRNPMTMTDVVARALSLGLELVQDKRTMQILIIVGVAILIGLINAVLTWSATQSINGVGNQVNEVIGILNSTRGNVSV